MRKFLFWFAAVVFVSPIPGAEAQWSGNDSGLCPNGRWVQSPIPGGGMGARCVPNQAPQVLPPYQQPSYNPAPTYTAPTYTPQPSYSAPSISNRIMQEWAALGGMINNLQPLRQNIPLSSGLRMMETVVAPPPASIDYVDPFAARTFPPITQSTSGPVKQYGSIWDPNEWTTLSPSAVPEPPSAVPQQPAPSSGPCGPYAEQTGVCSAPVTGFGWTAPY
jgi:hypothetical protein